MNKQLYINGDHRFPVSTEALEFIQQQIFLVARLCHIVGANVIIKQPAANANPPASWLGDDQYDPYSGLVIIAGKLYPLYGNSALDAISIYDATDSVQVETSVVTVRSYHFAQYTANGKYPLSTFTTTDTIVRLMQRISTIEDNYLTETAIRALVQSMQTEIDTTGNNLSSLINRVATIENNYRTAAQINELLAANAQHHLPKGSIIDWYGTADFNHIPYGYVPCGCFFAGSASQFSPDGAGTQEIAKWKSRYSNIQIATLAINGGSKIGIRIYSCNSQTVPDLTDRFIVQAGGNYSLGNTGGDNEITLTTQQMPQHIHGRGTWNSQGGFKVVDLAGGLTKAGAFTEKNRESTNIRASGSDDNWRVTVEYDWAKGLSGSLGTAGGSQPHENRPPYFALYKLIKVI